MADLRDINPYVSADRAAASLECSLAMLRHLVRLGELGVHFDRRGLVPRVLFLEREVMALAGRLRADRSFTRARPETPPKEDRPRGPEVIKLPVRPLK